MKAEDRKSIIKELKQILGVGDSIANDLFVVGIKSINDLKRENPELLYEKLCKIQNKRIDRCVLYVFREAVYYASNRKHKPELLKWWNWKD